MYINNNELVFFYDFVNFLNDNFYIRSAPKFACINCIDPVPNAYFFFCLSFEDHSTNNYFVIIRQLFLALTIFMNLNYDIFINLPMDIFYSLKSKCLLNLPIFFLYKTYVSNLSLFNSDSLFFSFDSFLSDFSSIQCLAFYLYNHSFISLLILGMMFLVVIVSVISLLLNRNVFVKRQNAFEQQQVKIEQIIDQCI